MKGSQWERNSGVGGGNREDCLSIKGEKKSTAQIEGREGR